ncbi:hypothetical protein HNR77_004703 [Paenibacillus sp. JGP012]|nr:hypothetical protein [Paenibacillus sp. JGP012]
MIKTFKMAPLKQTASAVPIPMGPPKMNAINRSTTLIKVLAKNIFVRVVFFSESVKRSIGIGAKLVCRYMVVPIPATTKPQPKHKNLKNNRSGATQVRNNNNQTSIQMPVISAVTNPQYSGFCFVATNLKKS